MAKMSQLPLSDLYAKPKITASVEAAILEKEDFSKISQTYCEKVCRLKCKNPGAVQLLQPSYTSEETNVEGEFTRKEAPVDILIVQDHITPDGKYTKIRGDQERIQVDILKFICEQAGLKGLNYMYTTLLKCEPTDADFPNGKAPTSTVIQKCRPYLYEEIKRLKPKVIISLSTSVTKVLGLKGHSNTGNRGEFVETPYGTVVITLHPRVLTMIRQNASGAMWGSDYLGVIVRDFAKAAALARGTLKVKDLQTSIDYFVKERMIFAKSIDDVKEIINRINSLAPNAVVSYDTETTSLDRYQENAKVITIQFGWRDPDTQKIVAGVIPLWHRENTYYNPDEAWELVKEILLNDRPKVAHNGKFDILYIQATTGVLVKNTQFDTMLLMHNLDSGTQGCYSLKAAVWDITPDLGFGGYENLLPSLTKQVVAKEEDSDE
jgi:uracil-DNA glycosylase family 4